MVIVSMYLCHSSGSRGCVFVPQSAWQVVHCRDSRSMADGPMHGPFWGRMLGTLSLHACTYASDHFNACHSTSDSQSATCSLRTPQGQARAVAPDQMCICCGQLLSCSSLALAILMRQEGTVSTGICVTLTPLVYRFWPPRIGKLAACQHDVMIFLPGCDAIHSYCSGACP